MPDRLSKGTVLAGAVNTENLSVQSSAPNTVDLSTHSVTLPEASVGSTELEVKVQTPNSSVSISGNGLYLLTSTAAGSGVTFTLSAPSSRQKLTLFAQTINNSSVRNIAVVASTDASITFNGSSVNDVLQFSDPNQYVDIVALSATEWIIVNESTGVTVTTTT